MYKNIEDLLRDMKLKYPKAYQLYSQFECDKIFELEDKIGMFFSSHNLYDMPFQLAFLVLEKRLNLVTSSKNHLGNG